MTIALLVYHTVFVALEYLLNVDEMHDLLCLQKTITNITSQQDMAEVTHTNLRGHYAGQVDHGEYNSSDDDKAVRHEAEKV